jgi:oligopeptide transport system ATP-binding protein
MKNLLEVRNLETQFITREGVVHAVNGVSFDLKEGETLGIVGESGSGKSVTMMSILGLIPSPPGKIVGGEALYKGKDLLKMTDKELEKIRGSEISLVFQDPMTSFNPVLTIGRQVAEPLEFHQGLNYNQAKERVIEVLELVGIPNPKDRLNDFPHQFSGGMRQRVMIAMSLICDPTILIADEPTTALDVTIQAQIVELVKSLRDKLGMAIIWITHDLGVIAGLADRMMVMYGGSIIETASVQKLYARPSHPYTVGLIKSLPRMDQDSQQRLESIEGSPPILSEKPNKCTFSNRCDFYCERCLHGAPELVEIGEGHYTTCWADPLTGKERE